MELEELIKSFKKKVYKSHIGDNKLVAVVEDEATQKALLEAAEKANVKAHVTLGQGVVLQEKIVETTTDRISTVYQGALPISALKPTGFGKKINQQFFERFVENYRKLRFFEPLIVDSRMEIIDGETRLAAIVELNARKAKQPNYDWETIYHVPVVVVNSVDFQSKMLRLILNKSNEFQRWDWEEVDAFLEEDYDYLTPILEPFAIFGERILPKSYFGDTIKGYEIYEDEFNKKSQQSFYKQEHEVARWAKAQRAKDEKLEQEKAAKKPAKRPTGPGLF